MPLICGGIVPHAPLLLEAVSGAAVSGEAAATVAAFGAFGHGGAWDLSGADVIVIASPHGRRTSVHGSIDGSLKDFGPGLPELCLPGDPVAAALFESVADLAHGEDGVDHGCTVPLYLLSERGTPLPPVVASIQGEADDGLAFGSAVAEATRHLAMERNVAFLASAHTAAGLTPRAPLTELTAAKVLDDRLLSILGTDVGEIDSIPAGEWAAAGGCGLGPLTAFGRLFGGQRAEVVSHEAPFGVGYLVAGVGRS